ncbi:MAG: Ser-Thr-rich GPI-anchored membrane family protein, partial [Acidimicrobiales bacterium]
KVASVNPSSTVTPVVSNAFNVVAPVVAVSTPDNAQAVPLGGQATINWTVNPASETPYKVELVDATGTEDTVVLAASVAPATNGASGSFVWTVATDVVGDGTEAAGDVIGADFVVRVTAVTTSGTTVVTGDSARFSIVVPGIAVGAMSAVRAGGEATITWAVQPGISGQAKIELTDGADPISTIVETIDASLGTYTWQVPVGILDDPSTVRLTMLNDDRVTGDSPEFTPALPAITVTTDTTTYAAGADTVEVSWSIANSIELPVKVELFKGTTNTATMAFFVEAGTTTYEWDVPAGLTAGTDYKVTVSAIGNDDLTDDSADFAVT